MTADAHTPIRERLLRTALALGALSALAAPAPAAASYGWPRQPFHRQHPVRGYFGDPRIVGHDAQHGALHLGIDISAPDGTVVYANLSGRVVIEPVRREVIWIRSDRDPNVVFAYWHVVPAVRNGEHAVAYRTPIGRIASGWDHVHFGESRGGIALNPFRREGLTPYRDGTKPVIHRLGFERDGTAVGHTGLSGRFDLVVEALDVTPLPVAAPWNG